MSLLLSHWKCVTGVRNWNKNRRADFGSLQCQLPLVAWGYRRRGGESGCQPMATGLSLCVPHQCQCGSLVNANGGALSRLQKHLRQHEQRLSCPCLCLCRPSRHEGTPVDWSDQMTKVLIVSHWCHGKKASRSHGTWLLSAPQLSRTLRQLAALRKSDKYHSALQRTLLLSAYCCWNVTVVPMNTAASSFFAELGQIFQLCLSTIGTAVRRLSLSGISVLNQRFNAVLLHKGFSVENRRDIDH